MHTQSIVPPRIDYGKISADKYDPNSTYKKGDLRIQYNTLWKAKQDIDIAEPWTESHWESTNLAEVIGSVYSRTDALLLIAKSANVTIQGNSEVTIQLPLDEPGKYRAINAFDATSGYPIMITNGWATAPNYDSYTVVLRNLASTTITGHDVVVGFMRISF